MNKNNIGSGKKKNKKGMQGNISRDQGKRPVGEFASSIKKNPILSRKPTESSTRPTSKSAKFVRKSTRGSASFTNTSTKSIKKSDNPLKENFKKTRKDAKKYLDLAKDIVKKSKKEIKKSKGKIQTKTQDRKNKQIIYADNSENSQQKREKKNGFFKKVLSLKKRPSNKKRLAIITGIFLLLIIGFLFLIFSPALQLKSENIYILGNLKYVQKNTVLKTVSPNVSKSMLLINTGMVEEDIRKIPGINTVHVSNRWPDSMVIELEEKLVIGQKMLSKDEFSAYDCDGNVVVKSKKKFDKLPMIDFDTNNKGICDAVFALSKDFTIVERLFSIKADSPESIKTVTNNNITIIWGNSFYGGQKNAEVKTILDNPNAMKNKAIIDVSTPTAPIIK